MQGLDREYSKHMLLTTCKSAEQMQINLSLQNSSAFFLTSEGLAKTKQRIMKIASSTFLLIQISSRHNSNASPLLLCSGAKYHWSGAALLYTRILTASSLSEHTAMWRHCLSCSHTKGRICTSLEDVLNLNSQMPPLNSELLSTRADLADLSVTS